MGVPEQATPNSLTAGTKWGRVPTAWSICGICPVEVKVKMQEPVNFAGESQSNTAGNRRKQAKTMVDRESAWCLLTEFLSGKQPWCEASGEKSSREFVPRICSPGVETEIVINRVFIGLPRLLASGAIDPRSKSRVIR